MLTLRFVFAYSAFILLSSGYSLATILKVPEQTATIAGAISASSDGDTVLVSPGRYHENVRIEGRRIVLASNFIFDSSSTSISTTIIDGSSPTNPERGSCVTITGTGSAGSAVVGFTVTGGIGTFLGDRYAGGGFLVTTGSTLKIAYNSITGNSATSGGGISAYGSSPLIERNIVFENTSSRGGGLDMESSSAMVSRNVFAQNHASSSGGGARAFASGSAVITDNVFYNNTAITFGGLIFDATPPTARYNDFYGNTNGNVGGSVTPIGDTTCCRNFNGIRCDVYFNIFRNPLFASLQANSCSTACASPLIDAGSLIGLAIPFAGIRTDIGVCENHYLIGDVYPDVFVDITDLTWLIGYVYLGGTAPCPIRSGDWNCDGKVNLTDITKMINYIFKGGPGQCKN